MVRNPGSAGLNNKESSSSHVTETPGLMQHLDNFTWDQCSRISPLPCHC